MKLSVLYAEIVQWQNLREKCAPDLIASRGECCRKVLHYSWIAEPPLFNNGANVVISERHDLLCTPIFIVGQATQKRRIRIIRFPLFRLEAFAFQMPHCRNIRKVDPFPSRRVKAQS